MREEERELLHTRVTSLLVIIWGGGARAENTVEAFPLLHGSYIQHAQNKAHHDNERNKSLDANTRRDPLTTHNEKDAEDRSSHEDAEH
jgi:hypothetical protein